LTGAALTYAGDTATGVTDMPDVYTTIAWAVAALAFVAGTQVLGAAAMLTLLLLALVALTSYGFVSGRRARGRNDHVSSRFEPTDEVFRNPGDQEVVRVHADPKTGERRYWKVK
jgi:hypothetical protein